MSCPYFQPDCPERVLPPAAADCPQCLRRLKRCPGCGANNRAFANFCRSCCAEFGAAQGNWTSYRGGSQRLGLLASLPGREAPRSGTLEVREMGIHLQLGESCRSLLGYDRHLIAISQGGSIEICDPELPASSLRLKADGPVSCEPCIDRGVLYLGSPGRLSAYSLGSLSLESPRLAPLWTLPLSGTPVQALTPLGNRLYVTVFRQDGRKEVQAVDGLDRNPPQAPRLLHTGERLSWTAADPESRQMVFLSQEGEEVLLGSVTHTDGRADLGIQPLSGIPRPFADQVPIALLGGKVFGVFGDEEKLCRLDARTGEFEQSLGADTKLFSLGRGRDKGWDGDGVQVGTNGVTFLRADFKDPFSPLERVVKGSPVVVQGRAAVLGMQDGRLRIYDLRRVPRHDVRRLTADGEAISALAAFDGYVAAGNARGVVKVFALVDGGAAA